MKKNLGIFLLLAAVYLLTALLSKPFMSAYNQQTLLSWMSLYSVLGIGVCFVIMTGGIDLSIGSVVGFIGVLVPTLLVEYKWPVIPMLFFVLGVALVIGLFHGLLVTKLSMQPFVVTLCSLLVFRGLARWVGNDQSRGFGNDFETLRMLAKGSVGITDKFGIPYPVFIMIFLTIIGSVFLNQTVYGRHLLALGQNEKAARLTGIKTQRLTILAYVICSGMAGLGGVLFALDVGSIQPATQGNFYELYAIAAAVLGGCSLRGGEGSVVGVIIGTALMRTILNAIGLMGVPSKMEFAILGIVILIGTLADEVIRRIAAHRRLMQSRQAQVGHQAEAA